VTAKKPDKLDVGVMVDPTTAELMSRAVCSVVAVAAEELATADASFRVKSIGMNVSTSV